MGRVTRIEPDQVVLTSGTVNMKRFERRPNETLVLAELLDRAVTLRDTSARVTVVDLAMELNRNRDWVISRLAVRTTTPRLARRRGQLSQVEWNEVDGLALPESDQGTDALLSTLSDLRPADVAHALSDMPDKRRVEVIKALDDERLADVLQEMEEDEQVKLLAALPDERAADVLEAMDDDDAADLLGEMSTADQQRLLELMEPEDAEPVRRLMTYADHTAGGMMTSEPVVLLPDATVAEALALLRNPELSPALAAQVFVVRPPQATPTGKFLGTAHIQRLLREPPAALVSGLCEKDTGALRPDKYSRTSRGISRRTTSSRHRSWTTGTGCSARSRWTTSSITCCPRAGATRTGRWPMAEMRTRLDQPKVERGPRIRFDAEAFGQLTEKIARFLGTGRYLRRAERVVIAWVLWNTLMPTAGSSTLEPTRSSS